MLKVYVIPKFLNKLEKNFYLKLISTDCVKDIENQFVNYEKLIKEIENILENQYSELRMTRVGSKLYPDLIDRIAACNKRLIIHILSIKENEDKAFNDMRLCLAEKMYKFFKKGFLDNEHRKNSHYKLLHHIILDVLAFLIDVYYQNNEFHKALSCLNDAFELAYEKNDSKQINTLREKSFCFIYLAAIQIKQNDFYHAQINLNNVRKKLKEKNTIYRSACRGLASRFFENEDFFQAIRWYREGNNDSDIDIKNEVEQKIAIAKNKHWEAISKEIHSLNVDFEISLDEKIKNVVIKFSDKNFKPNIKGKAFLNSKAEFDFVLSTLNISALSVSIPSFLQQINSLSNQLNNFKTKKLEQLRLKEIADKHIPSERIKNTEKVERPKNENKETESSLDFLQEKTENKLSISEKKRSKNDAQLLEPPKSEVEKLGFSNQFKDYKVYKLSNSYIPEGTYYAIFNPINDKRIPQETLDQHQSVLSKEKIVSLGQGVRFTGKNDRFKTSVISNSQAGNIRIWSRVVEETKDKEKGRKILLEFCDVHTHSSQKKLYQK